MSTHYLLDACALIAYINDEDGADVVDALLNQASDDVVSLSMSMVNILEVYYGVLRDFGHDKAEEILIEIFSLPIIVIPELTGETLREAGRLKANHRMSLADSVALGIASVYSYTVVTADHHELDSVSQIEPIQFLWIR